MLVSLTLCFADEASIEAGQPIDPPEQKVAVVAITDNQFAGSFDRDVKPLTDARFGIGQTISKTVVAMLVPHQPDGCGKAAIVINGKQERGVTMLTTVFANVMRNAVHSNAWISSVTKRVAPGATIDIPVALRGAHNVRCHYDGMTMAPPHAPLPNEIAIIRGFANCNRPNDRVGELAANEIKAPTT